MTSREAGAITAYSQAWNAPQSLIFLCPSKPSETQEGLADAGTLSLDPACQRYGPFETKSGIDHELGLGAIDAGQRATFDAAPEWWIVVIGVEDGSARGIYKTIVRGGPIDPSVTPGPSPTPAPSQAPSSEPAGSAAP